MLSPYKKKLIMGYIERNIERGYIDLADNQIAEHIDDFTDAECEYLYNLINAKIDLIGAESENEEPLPEIGE